MKKKILSVLLFFLITGCSNQNVEKTVPENNNSDSIIKIENSESNTQITTIRIQGSNKAIRIETSGSATINVENSGRTIRIESSGTSSRSTIRIQGSKSKSSNWENPWDDSRWQDNKVPWLEHTQGYPGYSSYKEKDLKHGGLLFLTYFFHFFLSSLKET